MAVFPFLYFGILFTTQVVLGIPWNARPAATYAGYDLERGPVLYEAYYPEEQDNEGQSSNIYQEKRYFDLPTVPERSYQILNDPYEISYHPEASINQNEYRRQPNSAHLSAFTGARVQTVQNNKGNINVHPKRMEEDYVFGERPIVSRDNLKSTIVDDYSFTRAHPSIYGNEYEKESQFVEQNQMNFGGEDVQRIVPINEEFIFGERPMNKVSTSFEETFGNLNQKVFEEQNFDSDYNRQPKKIQSLPLENIFEPRPQVINYIFSSPKKATVLEPVVDLLPESENNEWPRNYGDNLIQGEIKKADEQELRKQEGKITSIEVSQVPHHKIRHHHGERPKRNYGQH